MVYMVAYRLHKQRDFFLLPEIKTLMLYAATNVYGGSYMNQEQYLPPPLPPHLHANGGGYVDGYGNHHHVQMGAGEGMISYAGTHPGPTAPGGNLQWRPPQQMIPYGGPHPRPAAQGDNPQWRPPPPYDNSYPRT